MIWLGHSQKHLEATDNVLSAICLATRYPEALPLKDVLSETVAEGLIEIFSRTGIPLHILTDNGPQFISALNGQLCNKQRIEKKLTLTYHPVTNGCLEHWHGTMVSMLKKAMEKKQYWAQMIKYALFANRSMPNASIGYFPFELIYREQRAKEILRS